MSQFQVGQQVRKIVGYPFTGKVVAVYEAEEKCSVRHKDGWDHIFHDKQLTLDNPEFQYLDLLRDCLDNGIFREGRNGGTYGLFGRQLRFDLSEGFPLLTTKKMFTKGIVAELLWFLSGSTNAKVLEDQGVNIWREWGDPETRELGPVYGKQWRRWHTRRGGRFVRGYDEVEGIHTLTYQAQPIDQIQNLIDGLRADPYGRRHIVSAWNPAEIDDMALPPCHCLFQFFVADGKLSCQLYQRSADVFLGVPFNIASYALLTHLIAREAGLDVGDFVHTFGDVHLYANHVDQAREQLTRQPLPLPNVHVAGAKSLFDLRREDILIGGYVSHPAIAGEVSA